MKKLIILSAAAILANLMFIGCSEKTKNAVSAEDKAAKAEITYLTATEPSSPTTVSVDNYYISENDIYLLSLVTVAEAEGECELGQRLVIDTILNRVDSSYFPNTVYDVIYQPYQFPSMTNGRTKRCVVTENIVNLVKDEINTRSNKDVIFFQTGNYSYYGTPMFQVGNHYFSTY